MRRPDYGPYCPVARATEGQRPASNPSTASKNAVQHLYSLQGSSSLEGQVSDSRGCRSASRSSRGWVAGEVPAGISITLQSKSDCGYCFSSPRYQL